MGDVERLAAETLSTPSSVVRSAADPFSLLYYRSYTNTPVGDKLMCVVVRELDGEAFVVTGYFTDRIKKGEVLWPTE
jgi:hypothetical protein